MDKDDIGEILKGIMSGKLEGGVVHVGGGNQWGSREPLGVQKQKLKELYEQFAQREEFQAGDILQIKSEKMSYWKSGKQNTLLVVLEVLDKPVRALDTEGDNADPSGIFASFRYDIVAAFMEPSGALVPHLYDSRYFKKYDDGQKIVKLF